jgi:hypothetical protein
MSELPKWPDKTDHTHVIEWIDASGTTHKNGPYFDELNYGRARADAAIARLKLAVEHIYHAPRCAMMQPFGKMACDCGYHEALAQIGPIPE